VKKSAKLKPQLHHEISRTVPLLWVQKWVQKAKTMDLEISNGKSSIVEERLYSFFFVFFQQKNEASFFRFSSLTQLGTKMFVLLRSCKIFKRFTSLCFDLNKFWNNPIRFTFDFEKVGLIPFASLCSSKILEQPGRFFFDLQKFR
jgi:hypothetical protein